MTRLCRFAAAASIALAAVFAAPALAAYICHPDPPGTRSLAVSGLERYTLAGPHVTVSLRSSGRCRVVAWNALTGLHKAIGASCSSLLGRDLSASATLHASIKPGTGEWPDRLAVSRGARQIALWPLPARARTVHVAHGYAVFSATDGATYAMRLQDGRVASLGAAVVGDTPQVNALGAVFAARAAYSSTRDVRLKFVPRSGIDFEVNRAARPLRTGGEIRSLAMDGPRVALAIRDREGRCDRVMYWNVLRAPVQRISAPSGPTCVPNRSTGISSVAIGNLRTAWLAQSGHAAAVVVGSPLCQEWVVRRLVAGPAGEHVVAMAADGNTIAFGVTEQQRELRGLASVDVVVGTYSLRTIISGRFQPVGLAVSGNVVATALADGTVDVRTVFGRRIADVRAGAARAIALDGRRLVVLRSAALDVYDLSTGKRARSIRLPRITADAVDTQYGIAVVAAGREVLGVDLKTGAKAVVANAPDPILGVALERPGVAFASTTGNRGLARFVPLARVEALLGRS
jgi:hypothetical protein